MKTQRKAFIDQIMLGFFLIAFTTIFIGTVSDEIQMRSKYTNLKKVLQTAVLSSAKYYSNEQPIPQQAEEIALNIIAQTALGAEVKDDIDFEWDLDSETKSVIATLPQYREDLFWFRLLHFDTIDFTNISAKANIIDTPLENVDNFLPIAVNGCTQEFIPGDEYEYLLKAHDVYTDSDNVGWYALSLPGGGESSFSHFKNIINLMMVPGATNSFRVGDDQNFYMGDDEEKVSIATVDSATIENDVRQVAEAFDVKKFESMNFTIATLDCGSTADHPILKEIVPITMQELSCAKCCYAYIPIVGYELKCGDSILASMICKMTEMFDNITDSVFNIQDIWTTGSDNECTSANLFKINFKVLSDEKVQLEY